MRGDELATNLPAHLGWTRGRRGDGLYAERIRAPPGATSPSVSPTTATRSPTPSPTPSPSASAKPSPTPEPEPEPEPTSVRPRVAGVIARNFDVPWGIAFLASGQGAVSERNTGRIIRVFTGKKKTLGEIDGVEAPAATARWPTGIALGDEETLYAFHTSGSDDRLVRVSLAGAGWADHAGC